MKWTILAKKMQWRGYKYNINILADTDFVETLKYFIVFNIYNKITEGDDLPKRKPVYHWAVHKCLYKTICFSSQLGIKVLKDFKFVINQMAKENTYLHYFIKKTENLNSLIYLFNFKKKI